VWQVWHVMVGNIIYRDIFKRLYLYLYSSSKNHLPLPPLVPLT